MPKKPAVSETDPRRLAKGSVIWHKGNQSEEVVRSVTVILHLANGESQSYTVGEDLVELLDEQPSPLAKSKLLLDHETSPEVEARLRKERAEEFLAAEKRLLEEAEAVQAKRGKVRQHR